VLISGDVTTVLVIEQGFAALGFGGNHVVDRSQPFQVQVDWEVQGPLGPLWLAALGGNWDVSVYAESPGGGNEIRLGTDNSVLATSGTSYSVTVNVPPFLLEEQAAAARAATLTAPPWSALGPSRTWTTRTSDVSSGNIRCMRTTIDLDNSVLAQLRQRQRRDGKTLGQVASELLARALADTADSSQARPLTWASQPMGARVDLEDGDTVAALLDSDR
jgi:hypothetical protein